MFLLQLGDSDTSLQIVGVYGLILSMAMLLCGAAIGCLVEFCLFVCVFKPFFLSACVRVYVSAPERQG